MKLTNISLPYPVLGNSDDVLPLLPEDCVTHNIVTRDNKYCIAVDLSFDNKDIKDLVEEDSAEFACEYECSKTMLRQCIHSSLPHFDLEIPCDAVNGRINFNFFIAVKRPLKNYVNSGFNSDYGDCKFDMEIGDILAYFPGFHYDADIKYDKLQAAGSFMQIRESTAQPDVAFDLSGNKIEILLPPKLFKLYCNPVVKSAMEIIHSSLVLNALTYALIDIKNHEASTWAKTIYYRLDTEEGFSREELDDFSKIPSIAQRLLKEPYSRLFNKLLMSNSNQSEE